MFFCGYGALTDYSQVWYADMLSLSSVQLGVHADFVIKGGSLGGTYKIAQLHFHWGKTDAQGSEHHKDHKAYPLEVGATAHGQHTLKRPHLNTLC